MKMAKKDNAREEYTRGWLLPIARWAGIRSDCKGRMRWGGDVVEGEDVELEFQRWEQGRKVRRAAAIQKSDTSTSTSQMSDPSRDGRRRRKAMPLLTNAAWGCMAEDIAWKDYKKSPPRLVRMWMFRKKLMGVPADVGDAGMQMLRKQDRESTREIIKELTSGNSMLQEAIAQAKEEIIPIRGESRVSKETLGRSGEGSSAGKRENRSHMRGRVIKSRIEDVSITDDAFGQKNQNVLRRKRLGETADSDMEKKRKRHMGFEREREGERERARAPNDTGRRGDYSCEEPRNEP